MDKATQDKMLKDITNLLQHHKCKCLNKILAKYATNKTKGFHWRWGDKKALCEAAGISQSHLTCIISRKNTPNWKLAFKLEAASKQELVETIAWETWATNKTSDHKAFNRKKRIL